MDNAQTSPSPPSPGLCPLQERAGTDLTLDETVAHAPRLLFGGGVVAPPPETRAAADLSAVLRDPDAGRPDDVLYTVYRGVAPQEAADLIAARGLVYVALVMRPGTVGREFARNRGHVNNAARATDAPYPEVHEVWSGRALLYLQKRAAADPEDVCVMPLGPGDKAVIAPGWASLLVNVGTDPLAVGTWRTADCVPQHADLLALGGMAHYIVSDRTGAYDFEPNPRYPADVPAPRVLAPHDLADFGLRRDQPMMTTFRRNPDFLRFLLRPQDHDRVWASLYKSVDDGGAAGVAGAATA